MTRTITAPSLLLGGRVASSSALRRRRARLHLRQIGVDLGLGGKLAELSVGRSPVSVKSSSAPDSTSYLDRGRAGLHLLGLVLRALDRQAGVCHLLADPVAASPILTLSLPRSTGLDHFLM